MSNQALREQIELLAQSNVVLHQCLSMVRHRQFTYEEALQMAVVQLVAITDSQQKTLLDFAMRQHAPLMIMKGESQ